jgi:16S rRNA (guanine(966)-N(2))-methyltransferase RsmD
VPPREVRIIGGQWKRSRLPVADRPGLRPTPDRVRETLFNWLGQDLPAWRVFDAFAGSGALGLEAASRGASPVLLVEQDAAQVRALQATVQRLEGATARVQVMRGDGIARLKQQPAASLDLVLLDPPFDAGLYEAALRAAAPALAPGGWIYLEAPRAWGTADADTDTDLLDACGLTLLRHLKAGAVHAHLLQRLVEAQAS